MEDLTKNIEKAHYGSSTHGICRKCNPPRRIFTGMARPVTDEDGVINVELKCPIHGPFTVKEESLEIHPANSGQ
jgi:hypothetical protein